jgi:hypothetical protein
MFGSLMVVFPTPHEGGALFLRHHGHEWTFNSAKALAAINQPTIGYVAFFSDIEHEVAPVISGHRVTLTYNLYFDDDSGPVSKNDVISKHLIPPQPPSQEVFIKTFQALLGNLEFMADGGMLAFGLRHVYPIEESLEHVYNALKGSDAAVYQIMCALGFNPVLYMYYAAERTHQDDPPQGREGVMVDKLIKFGESYDNDEESDLGIVRREGGIPVRQSGGVSKNGCYYRDELEDPEPLEWVTPLTAHNLRQDALMVYGNDAELSWVYGDVCMVVRIGKAGDRLAFPTVAEVKRVHEQKWRSRAFPPGYGMRL